MFFPVNAQYLTTDGTAAPPANLRNFTPFHRSGFDTGAQHAIFTRGRKGRATGEHGRLRYYDATLSAGVVELDDTSLTGTATLWPVNDERFENERAFQRIYASGMTETLNYVHRPRS